MSRRGAAVRSGNPPQGSRLPGSAAGRRPVAFTTYRGRDGQWYVRHARGKITGDFGEGYSRRADAVRAIRRHVETVMIGCVLLDGRWPA